MKIFISFIITTFIVLSFEAELPQSSSIAESVVIENIAFIKIGTYRGLTSNGAEYQKSYFFPRHLMKTPWIESRAVCNSYDFELTIFETLAEAEAVLTMAENNSFLKTLNSVFISVDAMTLTLKSTTDWYWTKTGQKISYALPWMPGEPNNINTINELCLSFGRSTLTSRFGFNDSPCSEIDFSFLCQKIEFFMPSKTMETVSISLNH
ncbi:hypothetical protein ACKWTF_008868 [Chironomus riparius]